MPDDDISILAKQVGVVLQSKKLVVVTAESCTGGYLAAAITTAPGSSNYFEQGFITYSNTAKQEMLGVKADSLQKFGAVSEQVAAEMAVGALKNSHAQISVSITGIAGPGGGTSEKPVGTVCFGFARDGGLQKTITKLFSGNREQIRAQAVVAALKELQQLLLA